jgi:hypothetical protein
MAQPHTRKNELQIGETDTHSPTAAQLPILYKHS